MLVTGIIWIEIYEMLEESVLWVSQIYIYYMGMQEHFLILHLTMDLVQWIAKILMNFKDMCTVKWQIKFNTDVLHCTGEIEKGQCELEGPVLKGVQEQIWRYLCIVESDRIFDFF